MIKEALGYCSEIIKLITKSTRRNTIFHEIQQELGEIICSITSMCPTRWTVRAKAVKKLLKCWKILMKTFHESAEEVTDPKMKVKLKGILVVMKKFDIYFGSALAELILSYTDNLSTKLQSSTISAAEGYMYAMDTFQTLESYKNETEFLKFYNQIQIDAKAADVDDPQLPRYRKINSRLADFEHDLPDVQEFSEVPEFHKKPYFEAFDAITKGIKDAFEQEGYKTYQNLESLLLKAAIGECYDEEFDFITKFYHSDINAHSLKTQLKLFTTTFPKLEKVLLIDIIEFMKSPGRKEFLSEVAIVLKLILVMPATNAKSERTFSKLKLVKDYCSNTMKQTRLNHLMICSMYLSRRT